MHLRILADVLAGLHHAHELTDYDGSPLGVVHRDVTPQNVFITYAGAVKVIDFGIAKAKCSTVQTRGGTFQGKITYMSREQALGEHVDRRADIFAVGVMLWEAVAGQRLWAGLQPPAILQILVAGRFPSLREASPDVPEELEAIVHKAIAPAREDRYATAADFQGALEAYLERCGDHAHPRDLGGLLERHFASERAALRALVEGQVRDGQQEKTMKSPAALYVEERITVPEPAVVRSRTGSYSRTMRAGSFSAIESPTPHRPRLRHRRLLASLGLLGLAALLVGTIPALPVRFLKASRTASAVPAPVSTVPEAAVPAAEIELLVTATPSVATRGGPSDGGALLTR
jgi:serine/threonine-protein kinase